MHGNGSVAIIPARYNSSRLPGKPLIEIEGRTLIEHVYRRVELVRGVDQILVATDENCTRSAGFCVSKLEASAIAQRFGDGVGIDVSLTGQVGDRARHTQHTPRCARRKRKPIDGTTQQCARLAGRAGNSVFDYVSELYGNRVVYAEGSALLQREGETIGAVGVSGATPDKDEELAQEAATAFAAGSG